MDDGSTDHTRAVVERYQQQDQRVRYHYQTNVGLSTTRARSVALAQGAYLALLDDDDLYLPNKLEWQTVFLDNHPDVALVYSFVEMVEMSSGRVLKTLPPAGQEPALVFRDLIDRNPIQAHGVLVRKAIIQELGGFRSGLKGCDDYDMWLRVSRAHRIAFLPKRVGIYHWHQQNMSLDTTQRYENHVVIYRDLLRSGTLSKSERAAIRRRCARLSYDQAEAHMDRKLYSRAASYYGRCIRFDPFVGLTVSWNKLQHPLYRFLRPYLATAYCGLQALRHSAVQESSSS